MVSLAFSLYLSFCFVSIPCAPYFLTLHLLSLSLLSVPQWFTGWFFFFVIGEFLVFSVFFNCTSSCSFSSTDSTIWVLHFCCNHSVVLKIWALTAIVFCTYKQTRWWSDVKLTKKYLNLSFFFFFFSIFFYHGV